MLSRLTSKYGLATHLALLASLPLALQTFLSATALSQVVFWLSGLALMWLLVEPSMRAGEHLSIARARVRASILHDPVAWFFLLVIVCVTLRWLNSGVTLVYDPEQSQWIVAKAALAMFPASTGAAGLLPMAIAFAMSVLVLGIRHGLGLAGRISFAVTAAFIVGLGGIAAATCVAFEVPAFVAAAKADMMHGPFWGTCFGAWLIIAFSAGVQAEAKKWSGARIPFCLSITGCTTGLLLFSPSVLSSVFLGIALLYSIFCFAWSGRVGSKGAMARAFFLAVIGLAIPFFFLMTLVPEAIREQKMQSLDFALAFSETYSQMSETLSRIAREIWLKNPWCGAGLGAFGLHVPFFADKADWAVLPTEPACAANGYWTLLAERGILGCAIAATGIGLLLFYWGRRLVGSVFYLRHNDDADIFVFACPPVVWSVILILPLILVECVFDSVFSLAPVLLVVVVSLTLSTASFPKKPSAKSEAPQKET